MLIKHRFLLFILAASVTLFVFSAPTLAEERITSYHADIRVNLDGSLLVTERITVISEQDRIRRGIFRDFPIYYRDTQNNFYSVRFQMISASRNGASEPYFVKPKPGGVRIYLGSEDRLLDAGEHVYEIKYLTSRQIGYFDDREELFWNVTGNDWNFVIERASATVHLPDEIARDQLRTDFYTGAFGEKGKDAAAIVDSSGNIEFETTRQLPPTHGLTIVVSWAEGVIARPTVSERAEAFLADNSGALSLLAGFILVLAYYLAVWRRVGRDPEPGVIFPRYQPPGNMSPAAVRFVMEMSADNRGFSAAIVNMAVKGYLQIIEDGSSYRLEKIAGADRKLLSAGESKIAGELFRENSTVIVDNANHAIINAAKSGLEDAVAKEYGKGFFSKNRLYFIPGLLVSLLVAIFSALLSPFEPAAALFLTFWLMPWSAAVAYLLLNRKIFMSVVFGVFLVAGGFAFYHLVGLVHMLLIIALAVINLVFFEILKAPSSLGRRVMDEIEGFALYLGVAEAEELKDVAVSGEKPPARSAQLFERFLPYAIALNVEQAWADKFTDVLAASSVNENYHPAWYQGSSWNVSNPATFGNSLSGSFVSAISSAAVAPGSTSGTGGGGFSGGGGGGGGGGGW